MLEGAMHQSFIIKLISSINAVTKGWGVDHKILSLLADVEINIHIIFGYRILFWCVIICYGYITFILFVFGFHQGGT